MLGCGSWYEYSKTCLILLLWFYWILNINWLIVQRVVVCALSDIIIIPARVATSTPMQIFVGGRQDAPQGICNILVFFNHSINLYAALTKFRNRNEDWTTWNIFKQKILLFGQSISYTEQANEARLRGGPWLNGLIIWEYFEGEDG